MQVTVTIHEAWLTRPEDLRQRHGAARRPGSAPPAGRRPAAGRAPVRPIGPEDDEEPFDPEGRAPARTEPDRGDAWEPDDRGRRRTARRPTAGSSSAGPASRSRT